MYKYIKIYIEDAARDRLYPQEMRVIFERGGNQGIGRNHQDPTGNARFTSLFRLLSIKKEWFTLPGGASGVLGIPRELRSGGGVNGH